MKTLEIEVETGGSPVVLDLTARAGDFVAEEGDGLLSVFTPHATAGLAIMEVGAGSDGDLLSAIDELLPAEEGKWAHRHGSPGHGRDHVLPALLSPSLTLPVLAGVPALGTWQAVVLVDTNVDNHVRKVRFSFIAG